MFQAKRNKMPALRYLLDSDLSTLLVAKLVEALRYKPKGRGFDSR
jgi:hypothetical protein